MSLHRYLLDGGYIHPKNEHTKPAGIWRKLETLYNLDALDEREDARQLDKLKIPTESDEERSSSVDADADAYSDAANKIDNEEFELPDADFAQDKWERRLETGRQRRSSSPMLMAELNLEKDPPTRFTPSFSIEPSDAATPASRKGRPRASTGGARGKPTAAAAASGTRRATRQAESVAEEAEEQEEEQEEESDEEAAEESEEQESEQSTPAPRSTRSTKGARSRPPARRGRGRGR
jgi:MRG-binding protein